MNNISKMVGAAIDDSPFMSEIGEHWNSGGVGASNNLINLYKGYLIGKLGTDLARLKISDIISE